MACSPHSYSLTIDHTKIGASDATNFPVLISGTYSFLKTIGNGGQVNNASGYDIVFYSDSALTTLLKFERVGWDATTGKVEFYVKVATVSHTVDTVIYMGVGDTSISTDQQDANNTWNTNFKAVYHFENAITDSTINGNHLTNHGTTNNASGKLGQGRDFDGASYLSVASNASISFGSADHAVETWLNCTNSTLVYRPVLSKRQTGLDYNFHISDVAGDLKQASYNGSTSVGATNAISTVTWTHGIWGYSGGTIFFYKNGVANGSPAQAAGSTNTDDMRIGTDNLGYFWLGTLDELRVYNIVPTADWITASYNSQNNPASFYTVSVDLGGNCPAGSSHQFFRTMLGVGF